MALTEEQQAELRALRESNKADAEQITELQQSAEYTAKIAVQAAADQVDGMQQEMRDREARIRAIEESDIDHWKQRALRAETRNKQLAAELGEWHSAEANWRKQSQSDYWSGWQTYPNEGRSWLEIWKDKT